MPIVHVAVGVVLNTNNQVLISLRADHLHQGSLWEFPGGKVEADETVQQALVRELQEELAIEVDVNACSPLIKIEHDYGDKKVLLDVWVVNAFVGEPKSVEGQPLEWVPVNLLKEYAFPVANQAIITSLQEQLI